MASLLIKLNGLAASRTFRWAFGALLLGGLSALLGSRGVALKHVLAPPPQEQTSAAIAAQPTRESDLSAELLGLFGPSRDIAASQAKPAALPESNLNLQVSAIFFNATPAQSQVILEDGDRLLSLKTGDEVRPGITLQKVESHRITLKRNGQLEQISFRGYGDGPGTPANLTNLPHIAQSPPLPEELLVGNGDPVASEQSNVPTPYQQYIQRKIAQNK